MARRRTVIILLFAAFVVSGCAGNGGGGSSGAVTVDSLQVEPNEIFAGSNVRVTMGISNTGELPAELLVGEEGEDIMVSPCRDIFDIESFSASTSNVSTTESSYYLDPGYETSLSWNLDQPGDSVPLNGLQCNLRFEVPFNYTVDAFQQVQIKEDSDVEGSEVFAQSSEGPLDIEIEMIGTSAPSGAPTFLEDDGGEALIRLVNRQQEESRFQGNIYLEPPVMSARGGIEFGEVEITEDNEEAAEFIADRTPNLDASDIEEGENVRMCPDPSDLEDEAELSLTDGESTVLRCDIDWELDGPSMQGEVYASSDYTFVKRAGTQTVDVRYRGE